MYFPHAEVVGDIGNALWQIKEKCEPQGHWDHSFFERCKAVQEEKVYRGVHTTAPAFPMNIQRVVQDLRRALQVTGRHRHRHHHYHHHHRRRRRRRHLTSAPTSRALQPSAILCLDNGMYKIHVARAYPALEPNTVLLDNALATMGAGLPAAIAAKVIEPSRQCVALCGDGGFMMNSQELETAVRMKLHIVVVVLNDSGYGMIKWKQVMRRRRRHHHHHHHHHHHL